jgi:cysteine-rich repeat protein
VPADDHDVTVCQPTTTTTDAGICGDGIIDPGETCDDGSDTGSVGDPCPADCVIERCTAVPGSARKFDVTFAPPAGQQIADITVAVDYPDGRVSIPGSGDNPSVVASITKLPLGHSSTPDDLDWELLEAIAGASAITPGRLFEITFQDCACAAPPTAGDFTCLVVAASDPLGNPVSPDSIVCSVASP